MRRITGTRIFCSQRGQKALLDEHYHVTRQSDAEMVEGLTEEERHELTRLLAAVYRNLLQMEKDRQAGNFNGNHL